MQKITTKTDGKYGNILNVTVNSTSKTQVLAFVRDSLTRGYKFWLATPNPEIILKTQKDKQYLNILNSADLALPDGIGVAQAFKFLSLYNPPKILRYLILPIEGLAVGLATFVNQKWLFNGLQLIKGREMFKELAGLANKKGWRIFLLGGKDGVAKKAEENLKKNYHQLKISSFGGANYDDNALPVNLEDISVHKETLELINKIKPHLLFVALGAPKQERWISKYLPKINAGGAMVIGGTLDVVASKAGLPPKWMSDSGLEWLWRLIREPQRIGRIVNAAIIFPAKIFLYKLNS